MLNDDNVPFSFFPVIQNEVQQFINCTLAFCNSPLIHLIQFLFFGQGFVLS